MRPFPDAILGLCAALGACALAASALGSDATSPARESSPAAQPASPAPVAQPVPDLPPPSPDTSSARTETPELVKPRRLGACVLAAKDTGVTLSKNGIPSYHYPPEVIEAESLLAAGKVQINGGQAAVQQMADFGPGWGGDAQLFWSGGGVGAVLDATITPKMPGTYTVYLHLTRAPDFGKVKTQVKGVTTFWMTGRSMDSWSPSVEPPFGGESDKMKDIIRLGKGDNHLSLMIAGKNEKSSGYLIGIDCIVLKYLHS